MEITVKACAKVNLSLDITGKREDGYHYIDSVFQSVSLADTLIVKTDNSKAINVLCDNGPCDKDNICYDAVKLFLNETGIESGVTVELKKTIPLSSGLGGGSSDAAAVLKALNKIFREPLKLAELESIAVKLGADVPFFLTGGIERVYSIGEKRQKIESGLKFALVIIKNSNKVSTAEMYKAFDLKFSHSNPHLYTQNLIDSIVNNNFKDFCKNTGNAFELVWDISKVKRDLIRNGALCASLSGSGPSVFGIYEDLNAAKSALTALKGSYKEVYLAEPTDKALYFE